MKIRPKKIGGSKYIIVPFEYNQVYKLDQYEYDISVSEDGTSIIYTRKIDVPKENMENLITIA